MKTKAIKEKIISR